MVGVYRLETQVLPGNGKLERTGLGQIVRQKRLLTQHSIFLKQIAVVLVMLSVQLQKIIL